MRGANSALDGQLSGQKPSRNRMVAGSLTQKGTDLRERSASAMIMQGDPKSGKSAGREASHPKELGKKSVSIYGIKSLAG